MQPVVDEQPLFSVIVPTCNRPGELRHCLDRLNEGAQHAASLVPQATTPEQSERCWYEVIVTDDGPTGSARDVVEREYPAMRWVAGHRRGPATNRNNGARAARGHWLVFIDDDCQPDPTLLAAYAAAITDSPAVNVLEGRIYADRPQRTLAESSPVNATGGHLWSANLAVRRAAFETIGGFDERFPYAAMEDVDFRYRLQQCGESFVFVPDAAVCHPWRRFDVSRELSRYEMSLAIYLAIHPEQRPVFGTARQLRSLLRHFLKVTVPGIWTFRGAGAFTALSRDLYNVFIALRMFLGTSARPRHRSCERSAQP